MNINKFAHFIENKYLFSYAQAQIGTDNASKFKYAMNALFRIVAYLQDPNYKKLLSSVEVNVANVISSYQMLDKAIKKWYDPTTQSYNIPNDWMNGKNILQYAMDDIQKATTQLKTLIEDPNVQQKLQFYLDSISENVQGIVPTNIKENISTHK